MSSKNKAEYGRTCAIWDFHLLFPKKQGTKITKESIVPALDSQQLRYCWRPLGSHWRNQKSRGLTLLPHVHVFCSAYQRVLKNNSVIKNF